MKMILSFQGMKLHRKAVDKRLLTHTPVNHFLLVSGKLQLLEDPTLDLQLGNKFCLRDVSLAVLDGLIFSLTRTTPW